MKKYFALFFVVLIAVSAAFVGCKKADAPKEGEAVEAPAEEAAPAAEEAAKQGINFSKKKDAGQHPFFLPAVCRRSRPRGEYLADFFLYFVKI